MIIFITAILVLELICLLLDKFNDYASRKYEASMNYEKMENQIPETTRKMGTSERKSY